MEDKLEKSIDRAISLLKTPKEYEKYISIKLSPPSGCCCSDCLPETWQAVNEFITPCGPVGHEGDALIEKDGNRFVLESHEGGPEIIFLFELIKKSADCLKSIIELITVFVKACSQEKRKQLTRIKISKRQIIKGKIEEENMIEIDIPISKDTQKQFEGIIKRTINKNHNKKSSRPLTDLGEKKS